MVFFIPQSGVRKTGFTATKKVGNAVKRNRAKRVMRALFIKYSELLRDGRYVFVAKTDINTLPFHVVETHFKKTLQRANALKKN